MKIIKLLSILLLLPVLVKAETTWHVYISTDPPNFPLSSERIISSTDTVKISLPVEDSTFSCILWKPSYFQIPGIPYPLGVHRYLECDLGKDYAIAAEVVCSLRYDDVHDTELLLQTPNLLYGISFQCANFISDNNSEK